MPQQASPDDVAAEPRLPAGRRHAVVIGASVAGLLAARVLSDHIPQVTVVERDGLPRGPAFRPGVPQSRHLHILLQRGHLLMEDLFPGLVAELRAAGAHTLDWPGDILWLSPGGWGQRWLEELGYAPPPQVVVNSFLGYASRFYARPRDLLLDWQALLFNAQPPAMARAGALFPVEGDRWIVTLTGAGRDYPPIDEAGFLAFARSLRSSILAAALEHAQPLSSVAGYQRTENQLRRYERLARRPEQFLVLGDAVCAFNPIYGQGMTVAGLDALLLAGCLRRLRRRHPEGDWTGLAEQFQRRLARRNATPWLMATGEDLRYPTTEGARPGLPTRLFHRYLDRLVVASTENQWVNRVFLRVLHMLAPPAALFRPSVLIPALRTRPDQGLRAPPTATPLGERQTAP